MSSVRTDCPHCHESIDGRAKPHCEGRSCGWVVCPSCKARIGRKRHACDGKRANGGTCRGDGGIFTDEVAS